MKYEAIETVASGTRTKAEISGYVQAMDIYLNGPVVLHICGNTDAIIPMMCDTGVVGISIEEKADLRRAVEIAHTKGVRVFGNVATATTLFSGTPQQCYQEAWQALEDGTDFLAPGCGVAPQTPLENIRQLQGTRNDYFAKTG